MRLHRSWRWFLLAITLTLILSGNAAANTLIATVTIDGSGFAFAPVGPWAQKEGDVLIVRNRTGDAVNKLMVKSLHGGLAFASVLIGNGADASITQGAGNNFADQWEFCTAAPLVQPCVIVPAAKLFVTVTIEGNAIVFRPTDPWAQGTGDALIVRNRTGDAVNKLMVASRHGGAAFTSVLIGNGEDAMIIQGAGDNFAEQWEFCMVAPLGDKTTLPCVIAKQGVPVPSLTGYGAIALLTLLAGTAVWLIRRKQTQSA
jgi:hypothetical protein